MPPIYIYLYKHIVQSDRTLSYGLRDRSSSLLVFTFIGESSNRQDGGVWFRKYRFESFFAYKIAKDSILTGGRCRPEGGFVV